MKLTMMFAAAALSLAACASDASLVNDPEFRAGYDAGCTSAHSAREVRSAMIAGRSDLFRRGFSAGVSACGDNRLPER